MILSDRYLEAHADLLGINPECINPISVDLTLGSRAAKVTHNPFTGRAKHREIRVDERDLRLQPGSGHYYLAHSAEIIALPDDVGATLYCKSSVARRGVNHLLAGLIEPGFHGQVTLELTAHLPTTLLYGERVVQLVLHQTTEVDLPYTATGRYQGQMSWTPSRAARDEQRGTVPSIHVPGSHDHLSYAARELRTRLKAART